MGFSMSEDERRRLAVVNIDLVKEQELLIIMVRLMVTIVGQMLKSMLWHMEGLLGRSATLFSGGGNKPAAA